MEFEAQTSRRDLLKQIRQKHESLRSQCLELIQKRIDGEHLSPKFERLHQEFSQLTTAIERVMEPQ